MMIRWSVSHRVINEMNILLRQEEEEEEEEE